MPWIEPQVRVSPDGRAVTIGDVRIHLETGLQARRSASGVFMIKEPPLVDDYVSLCREHRGGRIVELGIHHGGSTLFLALLANPSRLVAIDQRETNPALPEILDEQGVSDVIALAYGVDQADQGVLREIVRREFEGESIDLVIDDASHRYAETLASFDALFPLLVPGGRYIIEDWNSDRRLADDYLAALAKEGPVDPAAVIAAARRQALEEGALPDPLIRLALELTLASAGMNSPVGQVRTSRYWVEVERSEAPVDLEGFRLLDWVVDTGELLRR